MYITVETDIEIDIGMIEDFIEQADIEDLQRINEALGYRFDNTSDFERLYRELDLFGVDSFLKLFLKMSEQKGINQTYIG